MNQTLRLSVAENGDPDGWITQNKSYSYTETLNFLNLYLYPYMKISHNTSCTSSYFPGGICTTLLDGTVFWFGIDRNGGSIAYYVDGNYKHRNPRNRFSFQFTRKSGISNFVTSTNYIEPYIYGWEETIYDLKNNSLFGCKAGCTDCNFCTKLIQLNGWKIPKDYPW